MYIIYYAKTNSPERYVYVEKVYIQVNSGMQLLHNTCYTYVYAMAPPCSIHAYLFLPLSPSSTCKLLHVLLKHCGCHNNIIGHSMVTTHLPAHLSYDLNVTHCNQAMSVSHCLQSIPVNIHIRIMGAFRDISN